jgi:hypothetical protein
LPWPFSMRVPIGETEFQKSAALPCAQHGALYAWLSRRWLTRSGDVFQPRRRADMMHAAASFGKALVCGMPRCGDAPPHASSRGAAPCRRFAPWPWCRSQAAGQAPG